MLDFPQIRGERLRNVPQLDGDDVALFVWYAALKHEEGAMVQSPRDVFISYASQDRVRVLQTAEQLEAAGVRLWFDRTDIPVGANFAEEIVHGIRDSKALVLMCSNASKRSRNVKQEIQLAWKHNRPYPPLLLEPISFPEQLEYFLEGWQWIDVLDRPPEEWLPQILPALEYAVAYGFANLQSKPAPIHYPAIVKPIGPVAGLACARSRSSPIGSGSFRPRRPAQSDAEHQLRARRATARSRLPIGQPGLLGDRS
jgi:hypothetical protein